MKRTLDDIHVELERIATEKRERRVVELMNTVVRPHLTALDNWHIDDLNKVVCAPIVTARNGNAVDGFTDAEYEMAISRTGEELQKASGSPREYTFYQSASTGWYRASITYNNFGSRVVLLHSSAAAADAPSTKSIYLATWQRLGEEYMTVVHREVDRVVAFLSDIGNWDADTRKSAEFTWDDTLKYTRYVCALSVTAAVPPSPLRFRKKHRIR
jgi:hypothetical protein